MFFALLLLSASPQASSPSRVLVMDLRAPEALAQEGGTLTSAVAEAAGASGKVAVMTSADLRALSNLAANQQECGADSTSCLAELAGAMDVQRVVHGSLAQVDDGLLVQLAVFDAQDPGNTRRVSWRGATLGAVLDDTPGRVKALLSDRPLKPTPPPPPGLSPLWGGVALGSGAALAGVTGIAGAVFNTSLTSADAPRAEKDRALSAGRITVVAGAVLATSVAATGAVLLVLADWE